MNIEQIETRDGKCPTRVFRNPGAAVIVFIDGIGMRPALEEIAQRIAERGYFVILPDMFYRVGPYEAPEPKRLFSDMEFRAEWFKKIAPARDPNNLRSDIGAFLDWLGKQPEIVGTKVGTTGYCMGGRVSFQSAGWFPDRVAAAGSFHPSGLLTDEPESPHLLVPQMKGELYIAGAADDTGFDDTQKKRLDEVLTEANVAHTITTYPARHGFVPSDTPVHDPAQAKRHFDALFELYDRALKT